MDQFEHALEFLDGFLSGGCRPGGGTQLFLEGGGRGELQHHEMDSTRGAGEPRRGGASPTPPPRDLAWKARGRGSPRGPVPGGPPTPEAIWGLGPVSRGPAEFEVKAEGERGRELERRWSGEAGVLAAGRVGVGGGAEGGVPVWPPEPLSVCSEFRCRCWVPGSFPQSGDHRGPRLQPPPPAPGDEEREGHL